MITDIMLPIGMSRRTWTRNTFGFQKVKSQTYFTHLWRSSNPQCSVRGSVLS